MLKKNIETIDIATLAFKLMLNPNAIILATSLLTQMKDIENSEEIQVLFKKYPELRDTSKQLMNILLE